MLHAPESPDVATLPLAPKNPLPYRQQLRAVRSCIDGFSNCSMPGGPVTRLVLRLKWLFPTMVLIASPLAALTRPCSARAADRLASVASR